MKLKRIIEALNHLIIDEVELKRKIHSSIATLVLSYEDVENVNNMIQNSLDATVLGLTNKFRRKFFLRLLNKKINLFF